MMFTSCGVGLFECISNGHPHLVDIINDTCSCRGWYYKKWCKHLNFFGVKTMKLNNDERRTISKALRFELNCLQANNKQKETLNEYKLKVLVEKMKDESDTSKR